MVKKTLKEAKDLLPAKQYQLLYLHYYTDFQKKWVSDFLEYYKSAGEIESWEAQKTLDLVVNGYKIGTYRIDFVAYRKDGVTEYIEAKGWSTPLWKMKWAIFEAMMSEIPDVELRVIWQKTGSKLRKIKKL